MHDRTSKAAPHNASAILAQNFTVSVFPRASHENQHFLTHLTLKLVFVALAFLMALLQDFALLLALHIHGIRISTWLSAYSMP